MSLGTTIEQLYSRTSTGALVNTQERYRFTRGVSTDIASIISQWNNVIVPLMDNVFEDESIDALQLGLSGNTLHSDVEATSGSGTMFWSTESSRALTIKESLVFIASEIARLETVIAMLSDELVYDDTNILAFVGKPDSTASLPDYGTPVFVVNEDSLREAIVSLDTALAGHSSRHLNGGDDEIDGDTINITYSPSNYTRNSAPAEVNTSTDLTAHLAGIDDALGALATTPSLQAVYSASTSGDIQLDGTIGPIKVIDSSPGSSGVFNWYSNGAVMKGKLTATQGADKTAIQLYDEPSIVIEKSTSQPAITTNFGKIYTKDDATSNDVELCFRNDNNSVNGAQITRSGRVKELEVGYVRVQPSSFKKLSAAAGPTVADHETSDMAYELLSFDKTTSESAYCVIPIPEDEDGNRPSRFKMFGYFMPQPVGGPYSSGTGFVFNVRASAPSGTPAIIADNSSMDPGWTGAISDSATGLGASSVGKMFVLEWGPATLTANANGVLNVKLTRDVANAADDWNDDVGLLSFSVVWYR